MFFCKEMADVPKAAGKTMEQEAKNAKNTYF